MGDDRAPVYREDGRWIMRASSFGACTTRLARHAAGIPGADVPQSIRDAFDFGKEAEPKIIRWLEANTDWEMLSKGEMRKWGKVDRTGQLALEFKLGDRATLRCHPDGIVRNRETGELRVLEVKTRARANASTIETEPFYAWQFSIERAVTGLDVLLVIGWKVPQTDDDGNTIGIRMLDGDPEVRKINTRYTRAEIKTRMLLLAKMFDAAERDGQWDVACDRNDYPCPFYLLCGEERGKGGGGGRGYVEVEEGRRDLFADLAREYAEQAEIEKAAKARKDEIRDELIDLVDEGKWTGGGWKVAVTISPVAESTRTVKAYTRRTVKAEPTGEK